MQKTKLDELAEKILAHLKRFEADPEINQPRRRSDGGTNLPPYSEVNVWATSRRVYVSYISFQGSDNLTRKEAQEYLAWLDAGNVGRHTEATIKL